MKAGWQTKTLGNICDILDNRRKPITKCDRKPGPYPYYGATGILDYVDGYLFDEPLILVGEDGAKWASGDNTAFAVEGKCWVNNHAHVLRPHRSVLLDNWLIHFLVYSDLSEFVSGLTVPKLNQGSLREISLPVPPLPEQQRIVTLLDEAFDGIATAKSNAEKNLRNARDLFSSHLQTVFSQDGEGWTVRSVQQLVSEGILAKPQDGNHGEIHPTKADYVEVGVPFIMAADLSDGAVDIENCRFISETQARTLRIGFAKSGDVLLSHKGTIGRVAVLETNDDYIVLTPQVTYYRSLDSQRLYNGFLYYCLLSPVFQTAMNRIADAGSTRAYIGITRQLDLQIALPSISVQHELASRLRKIQETAERLETIYQQKLIALDALKKSLLHRAFNGDL